MWKHNTANSKGQMKDEIEEFLKEEVKACERVIKMYNERYEQALRILKKYQDKK